MNLLPFSREGYDLLAQARRYGRIPAPTESEAVLIKDLIGEGYLTAEQKLTSLGEQYLLAYEHKACNVRPVLSTFGEPTQRFIIKKMNELELGCFFRLKNGTRPCVYLGKEGDDHLYRYLSTVNPTIDSIQRRCELTAKKTDVVIQIIIQCNCNDYMVVI